MRFSRLCGLLALPLGIVLAVPSSAAQPGRPATSPLSSPALVDVGPSATVLAPTKANGNIAAPPQEQDGTGVRAQYGSDPAQSMTLYPGSRQAILYVHGGCWQRSAVEPAETTFAQQLHATTGWTVAVMNYRTSGPRWRTEEDDVTAALHRLQLRGYRVALWGESAGAQLSLLAAEHTSGIRAVVAVSGPTDMTQMLATPTELYLHCVTQYEEGNDTDRYRATSPLRLITRSTPPVYLANATSDPLVPLSQAEEFARAMRSTGRPVQLDICVGKGHGSALEAEDTAAGTSVSTNAISFLRAFL
jgi:acetyl esterase/lipase